uniref:Protein kinase domain-containing protein n=1 Tax=Calcidiscus leptoporus TaxID=127549 RepID=A0A7S0J9Z7_9EUKA|mmetsp:Transcript_4501/g.10226  ORF Transcript_4501/g.10226 Transcript_4501/m.10226 type:complete len:114 (+) Transcript_4501:126-467(+)
MAPELYRGRPYGAAVDVFAYGVLLSRILARAVPLGTAESLWSALSRAPFEAAPYASQCIACCYDMYCRPALSRSCPEALAALVRDCCAMDASKRPTMATVHRRILAEEALKRA